MTKAIEIRSLLDYKYPENLMYSPDGKILAFQIAYPDEKKNSYRRDVWMIRGGKLSQLTSTINASAVFWEDDTHLVIRRTTEDSKPGTTDLYVIDVNGGEAVPFMTLKFAAGKIVKVRDGVYAASGEIKASDPDRYLSEEEVKEDEEEKDYQVVDEVPYWFNGQGFTNGRRNALFILDHGAVKRVTEPYFDMESFTVDGNDVYFLGNTFERSSSLYNNVYVYRTDSGELETVYGKNDLSFSGLFVLDGQLYGQASDMKEYGVNETGKIVKVAKDAVEELFKPEVSLRCSTVGDTLLGGGRQNAVQGRRWFTLTTVEDHNEIWSYDAKFNRTVVFKKAGSVHFLDVSANKIAFVREDWNHLGEVYECNLDGSNFRRLTKINDEALKDTYIAKPQVIRYRSEGERLKGWVLLPKDYDPEKTYPAVLDVHGGPRCIYSEIFFHEMQVWASKGYFVFFTNIRGSDGRGDKFADIRGEYGFVDFENLMDFTNEVLKKYPQIDPARLCETGGSYGGFMTNWIIGHTDRFCACASQRSISNWVSMSFISDIGLYFGPDQCAAPDLYNDTDILWNHSPLKYADCVTTPTLFIHSDEDYRCPLPEGMQMMQALAHRGIETRMVIFHGENHELSRGGKPKHRIRRLTEITDWFDKHTAE